MTRPLGPVDGILLVLLMAACTTDLRSRRIPNALTFPILGLGVLMAPLHLAWWEGLMGALVAFGLALPGWRFGGAMRAGDVKLLMAAGALLGVQGSLRATVFTYLLALPFGLMVLAVKGRLSNLWNVWVKGERDQLTLVAFAPVIAFAVAMARLQPWPVLW